MRPWEEIIPEKDRLVYGKAGFGKRQPFGAKPALLIIDVVLSFTGSKSMDVMESIDEFKTSCGHDAWAALKKIEELVSFFRRGGLTIVYTKGDPVNKGFCGDSTKGISREESLKIHSQAIPEMIAPLPTEYVLHKTKASAFFATPLATYLHRLGVDCIVACGTTTSGCVRATVTEAFSYGYTAFVVEEACFDRSQFSHLVNLYEMNAKYADVIGIDELFELMKPLCKSAVPK